MTPEGWRELTFGDAVGLNSESLKATDDPEMVIQYLDIAGIPQTGQLGELKEMTLRTAPSRAKRIVSSGDTLVSTVRPYLKAFAHVSDAPDNMIASTGFAVLSPKSGTDANFLYQAVLTDDFVGFLKDRMKGSNYPAVNASDIAHAPLLLPPLPEQKKIAAILGSVDEAIAATQAVIDQTRKVKQGLLAQLLTRGIGHTRFKKTEIGEIPEEWEVATCGTVCSKVTDGEHLTPNFIEAGQPLLSAKDVREFGADFSDPKYVASDDFEKMQLRCNPEYGDVLVVSRGATIGRTALNTTTRRFALMGSVILLKPDRNKVSGTYLANMLRFRRIQNGLLKLSGSSAQQAIYLKDIKGQLIPLPPGKEQEQIDSILSSIDDQIGKGLTLVAQVDQIKAGLMQDLLTGRVRMKGAA